MGTKHQGDLDGIERRVSDVTELLCDSPYVRRSRSRRFGVAHIVRGALLHEEPVRLVKYWGVGGRGSVGPVEAAAALRLSELTTEIRSLLEAEVKLDVLVTDTHAMLNRFPREAVDTYCIEAVQLLEAHGFTAKRMTAFMASVGQLWILEPILADGALPDYAWLVPEGKRRELIRLAGMHTRRAAAADAAARYCAANLVEASAVARAFPSALFLTYSAPGMTFILPQLVTIHLWTAHERDGRRPWFASQ